MNLSRRSLLGGIIAACSAPAIVRAGLIMPIKPGLVGMGNRILTREEIELAIHDAWTGAFRVHLPNQWVIT